MYVVVFRNRKRADIDQAAYGAMAQRMEELAAQQPGFVSFKSYTAEDGEVVALSELADEDAARAWGRQAEHLVAQGRGRTEWYADYTLLGCTIRAYIASLTRIRHDYALRHPQLRHGEKGPAHGWTRAGSPMPFMTTRRRVQTLPRWRAGWRPRASTPCSTGAVPLTAS
jgi:heme-degrading monooxygenase HmoA